jgi:hypothetical protein
VYRALQHDGVTRAGTSVHSQTCYYHTEMDTPIFRDLLPALKADMVGLYKLKSVKQHTQLKSAECVEVTVGP